MSKTVAMHQCIICGNVYSDHDKALRCEGRHLSEAYDAIHAGECPSCGGLTLLERDKNFEELRFICENMWCNFSKSLT